MEKDIVDGKIGEVGAYDLEFKAGVLSFKVSAGVAGASAAIVLQVTADAVIDALAKAIPGQMDDALLGLLKSALKA